MKHFFVSLFGVFFFFVVATDATCASISGHVTGNKEKQLKVFYPFNGFTTVSFLAQEKSLVAIDSSSLFNVQLDIGHPTFIILYIDYNPIDLFVDDSSNLFVEIHLDSIKQGTHKDWLNITGKYARGNLFFNEYNFYPYSKYSGTIDFFSQVDNFELSYLKRSIDSLVNNEIMFFDSLLLNKEIDNTFWTIVTKNIRALLYHEIIRHPITDFSEKRKMPAEEITNLLDWLFSKCDPLDQDLLYGTNATLYTKHFFLVRALQQKNRRLYQELDDSVINRNGNNYILTRYYKYLFQIPEKNLRENYWAEQLFSFQRTLKGIVSNNDIQLFKCYFPDSKWLPYLKGANGTEGKILNADASEPGETN